MDKTRPLTTIDALRVVATHAAASALTDAGNQWERYPEVGEQDWATIIVMIDDMIDFPDPELFAAAYQVLQDRAILLSTPQPPYPWCPGNPTRAACIQAGYCRRNPSCGS